MVHGWAKNCVSEKKVVFLMKNSVMLMKICHIIGKNVVFFDDGLVDQMGAPESTCLYYFQRITQVVENYKIW